MAVYVLTNKDLLKYICNFILGKKINELTKASHFVKTNNLYVLQYSNNLKYPYNIMDCAAGSGHLEIMKWLHENMSDNCTERAMDNAATNGHLGL